MSDPGDRKLADIVLVDLIERTISPGVGGPIVLRPVVRVFGARIGRKSDTRSTKQTGKCQARRRRRFARYFLPHILDFGCLETYMLTHAPCCSMRRHAHPSVKAYPNTATRRADAD